MGSILSITIGGAAAPWVSPVATTIRGTSIGNWGDTTDSSTTNFISTSAYPVGWIGGFRSMIGYKVDLNALETKIEVGGSRMQLTLGQEGVNVGYVFPGGGWPLKLYEIEGTIDAGMTWRKRATGIDWYGSGYGPKPDYDFVTPALDSHVIDATEFSTLGTNWPNGAVPDLILSFDLGDAIQRARDERRNLYLLLTGEWANPGGAGDASAYVDDASSSARNVVAHTQVTVDYWPAIAVHSALDLVTNRPADYTKMHDPLLAGTSNRTYLGAVEQGTLSSELKEWIVNHRTSGPRRAVVVGTSRSEPTSVDSQNGLGVTLKHVDTYDRGTGECSVDGDYVATAQDTTHYSIAYTNTSGVTVTLAEQTTGLTSVTFASDHIFVLSGSRILKIRSIKWSATTVTTGAVWRWSIRGDKRTTESVDTLSMVRVMPPVDRPFGNDPDSSTARPLRNAFTQQLWGAGYHDVDIAGTTHTHLYVRDVTATDWLTTATSVDAWCEVVAPGTDTFVSAQIEAAYGSTDGSYPDEIRLNRLLSGPEKALCTNTSLVSGGVILGDLYRQQFRLLSDVAAADSNQLVLASAFDAAVSGVRVYRDGTGASEHTVTSGGATSVLTVTPVLPFTYPVGTYVSPLVDPDVDPGGMPERPYYVNGKVPTAQQEGLYTGYYDVFEARIV